jgi:glucan phosphoethanolaminetransferase (alkaline phosphatase superfamily)
MKFFIKKNGTESAERVFKELFLVTILIIALAILLQGISKSDIFFKEAVFLGGLLYDVKDYAKILIFVASYIFGLGIIISAITIQSPALSAIISSYVVLTYFIDISLQLISGERGFTNFQYLVALNEYNNYENMYVYAWQLAKAAGFTFIIIVILAIIRLSISFRLRNRYILILPLFIAPTVIAKMVVSYVTYPAYPPPIKLPVIIAHHHITDLPQPPRLLSNDIHPTKKKRSNILLIIDESIGGFYLSINGGPPEVTPNLSEKVKSGEIVNFGVVNSLGNCSAISQLFLRIGLSPDYSLKGTDFSGARRSLPTIYQYAKRAGYKTVLYDSQNRTDKGGLQNYMTYDDLRYVDAFMMNEGRTKDSERDFVAIEKLAALFKTGIADGTESGIFAVLVKDGAHWPYRWRYPESKNIFNPVQVTEYESMTVENKNKIINTYLNVTRHTVNDFFNRYFDLFRNNRVFTIYTSDHGQAFFEGENDNLTHCSTYSRHPTSQVAVPLLVIDNITNSNYKYDPGKLYSQQQIFPTLLKEMGYDNKVTDKYGISLEHGYSNTKQFKSYWSIDGNTSLFSINMVKSNISYFNQK